MVNDSFKEFIKEQLGELKNITIRPMFGGAGIYWNGNIFGVLDDDSFYLKINDKNRTVFEEHKMKMFEYAPGKFLKSYYLVPVEILEDRDQLTEWVREFYT